MLNVIDEFTRECLAIRVNRKLRSTDVIDALSDLSSCVESLGTFVPTMARSSFIRPHSSLGYRPPAPEAFMPKRPAPQSGPAAPHALTLVPRPTLN